MSGIYTVLGGAIRQNVQNPILFSQTRGEVVLEPWYWGRSGSKLNVDSTSTCASPGSPHQTRKLADAYQGIYLGVAYETSRVLWASEISQPGDVALVLLWAVTHKHFRRRNILVSMYVPALPTLIQPQQNCLTLLREITALRITKSCHSNHDLAVLAELPKGAVLTMCGAGFNHRTATVKWGGDSYYVFEQDLPSPC